MEYFINEAVDLGIKNYIKYKNQINNIEYNSFLTVVIRSLCVIYDELDIINPFTSADEETFKNNILKYSFDSKKYDELLEKLNLFYQNEKTNLTPNNYFIEIEKLLIDMFISKKMNYDISSDEETNFKNLLYSPYSQNILMISYNYLHSKNPEEIINYYNNSVKINKKIEIKKPKELLNPDAYRVLDINYTDVCLLNDEQRSKINEAVYAKLNVNKNAVNADYLFDKALSEYFHKDDKITTGNGYVDILLIMGIVCTLIMLILVGTVIFL